MFNLLPIFYWTVLLICRNFKILSMNCHFCTSKMIECQNFILLILIYMKTRVLCHLYVLQIFSTLACLSALKGVFWWREVKKFNVVYMLPIFFFLAFVCPWNEWGWQLGALCGRCRNWDSLLLLRGKSNQVDHKRCSSK